MTVADEVDDEGFLILPADKLTDEELMAQANDPNTSYRTVGHRARLRKLRDAEAPPRDPNDPSDEGPAS